MSSSQTTDPRHWQRINALLAEALPLDDLERGRWFAELQPQDQPLLPTLRTLLARAAVETDEFMQRPVAARILDEIEADSRPDRPGVEVGAYRLLRELGAGGMGTVWLAERADGTWQRQVAIKLPRTGWALGVAERLEQERDTLSALEHPNIARLYDAGTTAEGRPYIAMEYVDGVPIDEYVAVQALTIKRRLDLFLGVAGAVAYAHARLIVHRDLKPSNILVSKAGEVRLLDFGAAKLLCDEPASALTRQLGQAMSPDYAAPEQIRNEAITVATDVYSLGIVLYELLTGQRPYALQRHSAAALEDAIDKAIVPAASSRIAGNPKQARALRGDLDTILAKALQRDSGRRYRSVEAFADDIARHLAGEPVLARPDSAHYRMMKFVKRHAVAVGATAIVLVAVGIGSAVALWQARVARSEAARAERVKDFIASIFTEAVPKTGVGGVVTASDLLSAASARLEPELAGDPAVSAELGVIIADSFDRLGEPGKSEDLLRTAVARAERAFGRAHPVTLRGKTLLAIELKWHDLKGALTVLDDVLPDTRRGLPATATHAVTALEEQAFILAKLNRSEASYAALRRALAIAEQYLGAESEEAIWELGFLSNTYGRFGERDRQLATASEALRRAQHALSHKRPHNTLISIERWYADALRANSRPADALPILRRVLRDQEQLDAAVTVRVRHAKVQLANALLATGRVDEALPLIRETVALELQQNPFESDDRLAFGDALMNVLASARRVDEALEEHERTQAIAERLGVEPPRQAIGREVRYAMMLALRGESVDASKAAADAARHADAATGAEPRALGAQARLVAALNARLQTRPADALDILRSIEANDTLRPAVQSAIAAERGNALLDLGNSSQAEAAMKDCRDLFTRAQIGPSVLVSACLIGSARVALHAGDGKGAEAFVQPLVTAWQAINPDSPWHGEALYWIARAQEVQGRTDEARRNAALAEPMLAKSGLPALLRLGRPR